MFFLSLRLLSTREGFSFISGSVNGEIFWVFVWRKYESVIVHGCSEASGTSSSLKIFLASLRKSYSRWCGGLVLCVRAGDWIPRLGLCWTRPRLWKKRLGVLVEPGAAGLFTLWLKDVKHLGIVF